jgi:hypothetical protein
VQVRQTSLYTRCSECLEYENNNNNKKTTQKGKPIYPGKGKFSDLSPAARPSSYRKITMNSPNGSNPHYGNYQWQFAVTQLNQPTTSCSMQSSQQITK